MSNYTGNSNPVKWKQGNLLTAENLNRIIRSLFMRIVGGAGIQIRSSNGQIVISTKARNGARGTRSRVVVGRITQELGGGYYRWERLGLAGPPEGEAREVNLSTGIDGTVVILHQIEGQYYFFFPVEPCSA